MRKTAPAMESEPTSRAAITVTLKRVKRPKPTKRTVSQNTSTMRKGQERPPPDCSARRWLVSHRFTSSCCARLWSSRWASVFGAPAPGVGLAAGHPSSVTDAQSVQKAPRLPFVPAIGHRALLRHHHSAKCARCRSKQFGEAGFVLPSHPAQSGPECDRVVIREYLAAGPRLFACHMNSWPRK